MHKVLAANVWDLPKFEAHIKTVCGRACLSPEYLKKSGVTGRCHMLADIYSS